MLLRVGEMGEGGAGRPLNSITTRFSLFLATSRPVFAEISPISWVYVFEGRPRFGLLTTVNTLDARVAPRTRNALSLACRDIVDLSSAAIIASSSPEISFVVVVVVGTRDTSRESATAATFRCPTVSSRRPRAGRRSFVAPESHAENLRN